MQRGSNFADLKQFQDISHSYMHAMRTPSQSAEEAERLMSNFIRYYATEYKRLLAQGKTEDAYFHLGMAMHPLMDATSPSHEGFQEWKVYLHVLFIPTAVEAIVHRKHET